jgi:hypothetical protein
MCLILENPERKPKRGPKVMHIATGVVTCSVCGSAMRYRNSYEGREPRYQCTREKLAVRDNLQHPTIADRYLERLLAFEVFEQLHRGDTAESADEAAPLRAERAELARRRKVQQTLAEMPGADLEAIGKRLAELGRDIDDLDARISEAVSADARVSLIAIAREALTDWNGTGPIRAVVEPQHSWLSRWDAIDAEKRQAIIRDVLGPVVLSFKTLDFPRLNRSIQLNERNEQE